MPERKPTAEISSLPPDQRVGKSQFAKTVGAFLPKVTAAVFQRFGFHSAEIMSSWETIVGPELARLTRPQSIKWPRGGSHPDDEGESGAQRAGATLAIATDPAFALDVSYRHKEIIDRINRYFGYRAIAQIKVYQVPGNEDAKRPAPVAAPEQRDAAVRGDLRAALEALGKSVTAVNTR